uniref:Uncharacterized protein n=1 Tax=Anguilla anguilla TaxID=7936 RepID=A0A0E9UQD7_ANGAN
MVTKYHVAYSILILTFMTKESMSMLTSLSRYLLFT